MRLKLILRGGGRVPFVSIGSRRRDGGLFVVLKPLIGQVRGMLLVMCRSRRDEMEALIAVLMMIMLLLMMRMRMGMMEQMDSMWREYCLVIHVVGRRISRSNLGVQINIKAMVLCFGNVSNKATDRIKLAAERAVRLVECWCRVLVSKGKLRHGVKKRVVIVGVMCVIEGGNRRRGGADDMTKVAW